MSELMAQFEQIARLEHDRDVQVELTELLTDRVAYLEESVLKLERVKATARSNSKSKEGVPPPPSLPGVAR